VTIESNPGATPRQAIFSVCADDAVVQVVHAVSHRGAGAQFVGEFRDYITAGRRPQFATSLSQASSCVALVDFDRDRDAALETAALLRRIFVGRISVIGVASQLGDGLLLSAVRSGCEEFLAKPVDPDELAKALARFSTNVPTEHREKGKRGSLIVLAGAKGGVGTTMLAVHLATHLAQTHRMRTLLVDMKPQLGHVGLFLGLRATQYHFSEMLRNADRLDAGVLSGLVVRHKSGLDVVTSPETGATADLHLEHFHCAMDYLRREYQYILLDAGTALSDCRSPIVEQADEIYAVATPDIAALRDVTRLAEQLSLAGPGIDKLRIVVNRSTSTDAVGAEQIEKAVRLPIAVSVPNSYAELLRAINDGDPVPPQSKSEFSQAIARWAQQIVEDNPAGSVSAVKKGLFSFLRR
jgi:pilus assembly protein CpaE